MTRDPRLEVGEAGFPKRLDLKALFDAFEVPWDEEHSRRVFARAMEKLEARERTKRQAALRNR